MPAGARECSRRPVQVHSLIVFLMEMKMKDSKTLLLEYLASIRDLERGPRARRCDGTNAP